MTALKSVIGVRYQLLYSYSLPVNLLNYYFSLKDEKKKKKKM